MSFIYNPSPASAGGGGGGESLAQTLVIGAETDTASGIFISSGDKVGLASNASIEFDSTSNPLTGTKDVAVARSGVGQLAIYNPSTMAPGTLDVGQVNVKNGKELVFKHTDDTTSARLFANSFELVLEDDGSSNRANLRIRNSGGHSLYISQDSTNSFINPRGDTLTIGATLTGTENIAVRGVQGTRGGTDRFVLYADPTTGSRFELDGSLPIEWPITTPDLAVGRSGVAEFAIYNPNTMARGKITYPPATPSDWATLPDDLFDAVDKLAAVSGDGSGGSGGSSSYTVQATNETAGSPYQIGSDESDKLFTNEFATAQAYFDLPDVATSGLRYHFAVMDTDGLRVNAPSGHTIRLYDQVSGAASGYMESLSQGSFATVVKLNESEWYGSNFEGDWTVL